MLPQISPNWIAIIAAVIVSFVIGFLWHGPLFGSVWAKLMKIPEGTKPSTAKMVWSILINVLGTLFAAYAMAYFLALWRLAMLTWPGSVEAPFFIYAFIAALFLWIGGFVSLLLVEVAWEGKSWKLFAFNAAYHFVNLVVIAMVIAVWP